VTSAIAEPMTTLVTLPRNLIPAVRLDIIFLFPRR
jgi:hypothetical protein